MTYWLLTSEFPPFYGGGISTYCNYTAAMLTAEGHRVTVFVQDYSLSGVQETVVNGVRVVRFLPRQTDAHKFLGYNAYLSYEFAEIIKRYMHQEGVPDILETQEYGGFGYYLQQFKLLGYPNFKDLNILVTCHAPEFLYLEYNHVPVYRFPVYWIGQMEKSVMLAADILVSPSRYLLSEVKKRMDWQNVQEHYVPNPIEISGTAEAAIPEFEPRLIVAFGKLLPLKGTFALLQYFEELWKEGFTDVLHLVGGTQQVFHPEGATMGDLVKKKYASYLKTGVLKLHDEMPPEAAREFLRKAHVVLVPSLVDNLPYTVLEAMSWGKVVLASKQGGQSEVISNGKDGFLFDHKRVGDFREKLLHILNLPDAEVKNIGQNAAQTIREKYSPAAIYPQKMAVIENYLATKKTRKTFPFVAPHPQTATLPAETFGPDELLSVVIPYYNMGAYIEACVVSILASDHKNTEILIVNDGSTDPESVAKLAYLQEKYPVTVLHKPNEGLSLARNFGANQATGRLMAFLDADDTVQPDYYTKAVGVLASYENVHFVGCWVNYFEGNTGTWPAFNPEAPYLLVHNMVNSSALVYKKASFLAAGLNDAELVYGMEDWDSVIGMVANGLGGVVLPEVLYNYRIRKGSMARSFTRVKKLHLHRLIAEKHAGLYRKFGVEVANLLNANGSGLEFDNPTFEVPARISFPGASGIREKVKEKIKQNRVLRKLAINIYRRIK